MTREPEAAPEIAVSGFYGCGNLGDEAVLAGIHGAINATAAVPVRLVALSQSPALTTQVHGMPAVLRTDIPAVRRQLRQSSLLISGGGSLLQDTTSLRSLLYYLYICKLARREGVPYIFYAQGLGPLRRTISRLLVRSVASHAAHISFRDAESAALLRSLGPCPTPVEITADPAFALEPPDPQAVDAAWGALGLGTGPVVGAALRSWGADPAGLAARYGAMLAAIAARAGHEIVLLPMHPPADLEFAQAVVTAGGGGLRVVGPLPLSPAVVSGILGRMHAVLAMRLHAIILAAAGGVPAYAFGYDPKVESLMNVLGQSGSLTGWEARDPSASASAIGEWLGRREQVRDAAGRSAEAMAASARRAAGFALQAANIPTKPI